MRKGEIFERINISRKEYKAFEKAEKEVTSAKVLKRIQAFKLIKLDWKYNAIAKFLGVTNDTITDWIMIYRMYGLSGLTNLKYKGRQPLLTEQQQSELKNKTFVNAREARKIIKEKYGITYNKTYIHELLKKNFTYPLKKQEKFLGIHQV